MNYEACKKYLHRPHASQRFCLPCSKKHRKQVERDSCVTRASLRREIVALRAELAELKQAMLEQELAENIGG